MNSPYLASPRQSQPALRSTHIKKSCSACPSVNTSPVFRRFFFSGRQALPGSENILQTFTSKCSLLWTYVPNERLLPLFVPPPYPGYNKGLAQTALLLSRIRGTNAGRTSGEARRSKIRSQSVEIHAESAANAFPHEGQSARKRAQTPRRMAATALVCPNPHRPRRSSQIHPPRRPALRQRSHPPRPRPQQVHQGLRRQNQNHGRLRLS